MSSAAVAGRPSIAVHDTMITSKDIASHAASPVAAAMAAAFLVGRDSEGHWLAVETHGLAGGIFASEAAAARFARNETERRPGAVTLTPELLTLAMR